MSPRIPELKDCGCGISLSFGAKIIAIVFFLLNSVGFLFSLYFIIKYEIDERNPLETDYQRQTSGWKEVVSTMVMVICTIQGTLAFCLWYGVKEHLPSLVLPWAILNTAFTLILTLIELLFLLHTTSWLAILVLAVILAVMYYCNLIVYSYFRELRRELNLPQTLGETTS